jgi:hypothetical protein
MAKLQSAPRKDVPTVRNDFMTRAQQHLHACVIYMHALTHACMRSQLQQEIKQHYLTTQSSQNNEAAAVLAELSYALKVTSPTHHCHRDVDRFCDLHNEWESFRRSSNCNLVHSAVGKTLKIPFILQVAVCAGAISIATKC